MCVDDSYDNGQDRESNIYFKLNRALRCRREAPADLTVWQGFLHFLMSARLMMMMMMMMMTMMTMMMMMMMMMMLMMMMMMHDDNIGHPADCPHAPVFRTILLMEFPLSMEAVSDMLRSDTAN